MVRYFTHIFISSARINNITQAHMRNIMIRQSRAIPKGHIFASHSAGIDYAWYVRLNSSTLRIHVHHAIYIACMKKKME